MIAQHLAGVLEARPGQIARSQDTRAPKVSVAMITYNHEKYLAQAVDGVLMQETSFHYEIVIGEDCSTDGTRRIVCALQAEYPDRIRLILRERNLGLTGNFAQTILACRGDYVALVDGDDYWTDPLKLQKQVDFLDANPDFVMCCHDVKMIAEGNASRASPFKTGFPRVSTFDDIWGKFFIPVPSLVFRNHTIREFPDWYYRIQSNDLALELMLAHHGKCFYIFEKMAVKRRHPGGITETASFRDTLNRLIDQLTIRKGIIHYTGRRGAALSDAVGRLHRLISVEYARRHDFLRSSSHLAAALFMSGKVRREVLVEPIAGRIPASARRMLRRLVPSRSNPSRV